MACQTCTVYLINRTVRTKTDCFYVVWEDCGDTFKSFVQFLREKVFNRSIFLDKFLNKMVSL
jgi:hypothetical protein